MCLFLYDKYYGLQTNICFIMKYQILSYAFPILYITIYWFITDNIFLSIPLKKILPIFLTKFFSDFYGDKLFSYSFWPPTTPDV